MNSNWQNRIKQHEENPPAGAWANIASTLDEQTGFAARLAAFETTPPPSAQQNIFALLDAEEEKAPFEKKLYNYKITAPEDAWQNIVYELDKRETKIIPLETRTRKPAPVYLRVAAAIAVIAVISIAVALLNRQQGSGMRETTVAGTTPAQQATQAQTSNTTLTPLPASETKQEKNTAAVNATEKTNVTETVPAASGYVQNNENVVLAYNPANGKIDKLQTADGQTPQDITLINAQANSYFTITGPDGETIKVSSKFSKIIDYLNDKTPALTENIDVIISESAKWKNTFAAWREKMTNNSMAPSISNFMDIIELSNVLEEKK